MVFVQPLDKKICTRSIYLFLILSRNITRVATGVFYLRTVYYIVEIKKANKNSMGENRRMYMRDVRIGEANKLLLGAIFQTFANSISILYKHRNILLYEPQVHRAE